MGIIASGLGQLLIVHFSYVCVCVELGSCIAFHEWINLFTCVFHFITVVSFTLRLGTNTPHPPPLSSSVHGYHLFYSEIFMISFQLRALYIRYFQQVNIAFT